MKILHDYQINVRQSGGGISRYHYELVSRMKKVNRMIVNAPCLFSRNYYFQKIYQKKAYRYKNKAIRNAILILNDIYTLLILVGSALIGKGYDIVHVTFLKPFYPKVIKKLLGERCPKIVVTVHDLIHEMVANENPVMRVGAKDREKLLHIADEIICISENTRKDLLHFYPWVDDNKITVVYHGYPDEEAHDGLHFRTPEKFILYVGARGGYKNFEKFIKAAGMVAERNSDINFVCAGGGAFSEYEEGLIKNADLEERVIQKFMTDEELAYCYRNALCFTFPSAYEGFGMPILEAFSKGCPVVLSNASCFPEIGGNAGIYFDWNNSADIANKLEYVINLNKDERNKLVKAGYVQLKKFSWDKTVSGTLEAYRKAVDDNCS